jgi:hypothetical protein
LAPKNDFCRSDRQGTRPPHARRARLAESQAIRAATTERFVAWKKKATAYARKLDLVGGDDVFGHDDPYELLEAAHAAFTNREDPKSFIRDVFAEDLASRANDEVMLEESLQQIIDDGE